MLSQLEMNRPRTALFHQCCGFINVNFFENKFIATQYYKIIYIQITVKQIKITPIKNIYIVEL